MNILCISSCDIPEQSTKFNHIKYDSKDPAEFLPLFNDYLDNKDYDIIGFLGPNDSINSSIAIECIANAFKFSNIELAYSYLYINNKPRYTLSYQYNRVFEQIYNNPIFVKKTDIRFDPKVKHLYFHDYIMRVSQKHRVFRIPYLLFSKTENENLDITGDITYICSKDIQQR